MLHWFHDFMHFIEAFVHFVLKDHNASQIWFFAFDFYDFALKHRQSTNETNKHIESNCNHTNTNTNTKRINDRMVKQLESYWAVASPSIADSSAYSVALFSISVSTFVIRPDRPATECSRSENFLFAIWAGKMHTNSGSGLWCWIEISAIDLNLQHNMRQQKLKCHSNVDAQKYKHELLRFTHTSTQNKTFFVIRFGFCFCLSLQFSARRQNESSTKWHQHSSWCMILSYACYSGSNGDNPSKSLVLCKQSIAYINCL